MELLAGLVGVALGGIISLTTTIIQLRSHRAQQADERTARRCEQAYIRLSGLLVRVRQDALSIGYSDDLATSVLDPDEWFDVQAHVEAFGSENVRRRFDSLLRHRAQLGGSARSWKEALAEQNVAGSPLPKEYRDAGRQAREMLTSSRAAELKEVSELLAAINSELRAGNAPVTSSLTA